MKKAIALVLALVMVFALCACGEKNETEKGGDAADKGVVVDGDTIKIGVFEPATGENGAGGMQEVLGVRYANTVAPTVTIGGKEYKVELVEVDNQSDKTQAVTAAQQLVSQQVIAVLGSYGSGVSIAAGETFASAKIPAIGCSCTNPQVTVGNDYYFRVCFLDPFQGEVMANFAYATKACETAAIITQNGDDYSTGLGGYFKAAYEKLGGQVVNEATYNTNETDFNALLTAAKAANPEVLFIPSSIVTAGLIIKQARDMGITCPIMAGDTWQNATIVSNAGAESCNDVFYSTFFSADDEAAADFVTGFQAYLNGDPENLKLNSGSDVIASVSALGYDAYMAVIEALKTLDGEVSSVAVRDALATLDFTGVTGGIKFDTNGDADKDVAFIESFADGKMTLVGFQSSDGKFTEAK
ncbi:MAG: ABC transporter substrate-binding protein [Oscillospiraceae bacterium]|nr:ABC transporter substrate-binding protein [Oscillospiraceae bacterium]